MKLYRGDFNWRGETHTLYTHARTESGAFCNLIIKLAEILGYDRRRVASHFNGSKDNYTIKEERCKPQPSTKGETIMR